MRDLRLQAEELVLQALAVDRVDRAEGLVHQHHQRVGGERPGDADPLLLAAGELRRVALAELRVEADQLHQLGGRAPSVRSFFQPSSCGTAAMFSAIVRWGKRPTCWIT